MQTITLVLADMKHPIIHGLRLTGPIKPKAEDADHSHFSEACSPGGSAVCDGFDADTSEECSCSCHGAWDLPDTVAEVRDWHDNMNDIVRDADGAAYIWKQV